MKILLRGIGCVLLVVVGYGAYYFIAPYFSHTQLDEPMPPLVARTDPRADTLTPSAQSIATATPDEVDASDKRTQTVAADYAVTGTSSDVPVPTAIPITQNTLIQPVPVIGTPGHTASGTLHLLQTTAGPVIRYENFSTVNGPDLYVYLATDQTASDFVSLGRLKATAGNINYTVPPGVDISQYSYVLVWCQRFGVLFNYARIQ